MNATDISPRARSLWAKSDRDRLDGDWHPVWCHLLDVAASARQILLLEPASTMRLFAEDLALTQDTAGPWVWALAGLHDLGKASPAFQQKNAAGAARVINAGLDWSHMPPTPPRRDIPHSWISQWSLTTLLVEEARWGPEAARLAADAIGAHHGWRVEPCELNKCEQPPETGCEDWDEVRRELFHLVLRVVGAVLPHPLPTLPAQAHQRLAGLTSFADWIGSSLDFGDPTLSPDDYWQQANGRAAARLVQIGWRPREPVAPQRQDFCEVFTFKPRPLQDAVASLVNECTEPALLLVEAPMGEGKTEAAFFAFLELQRQLGHRGLYVALPTKATGNAMFTRTVRFLKGRGRSISVDIHLLHDTAEINEEYLTYRSNTKSDAEDGVTAEAYFTPRKRALLSEYGVGTVDQALITVLPVKHQFVRLWGLGNRVVVIDEVHAYDTYTGRLLDQLLLWLKALGSSVILMSATLPTARRSELLKCWGGQQVSSSYPRAALVSGGTTRSISFGARALPPMELVPSCQDLGSVAAALASEVAQGGCVACIVNTVDRAQRLFQSLRKQTDAELLLFHARFPMEERESIEREVVKRFGGTGERRRPAILVATQVVEQSLDLDFDVMYTDLAPIDLLLQRSGRLHRHDRPAASRFGHTVPRLHVMGLATDVPELETWHWTYVYDEAVLLRTWLCLKEVQTVNLPGDVDRLVQEVYGHREPWGALAERLTRAEAAREKAAEVAEAKAFFSSVGSPQDGSWKKVKERSSAEDEGLEPQTQLLATRLGDRSLVVVPLYRLAGKAYFDPNGFRPASLADKVTGSSARSLYGRSLSISRKEIVGFLDRIYGKNKRPWAGSPLLRGLFPLYINEPIGKLSVEMSEVLGLVYKEAESEGQ